MGEKSHRCERRRGPEVSTRSHDEKITGQTGGEVIGAPASARRDFRSVVANSGSPLPLFRARINHYSESPRVECVNLTRKCASFTRFNASLHPFPHKPPWHHRCL